MTEETREGEKPEPKFHVNERVIWSMGHGKPHGVITDGPFWGASKCTIDSSDTQRFTGIAGFGHFYSHSYVVLLDEGVARLLGEQVLERAEWGHYCLCCGHKLKE